MKIEDLVDKTKITDLKVKIIFDKTQPKDMFGKKIKEVIVANIDSEPNDGSKTAYLDLVNEQIEQFKHMDKLRILDGYAKKIPGKEQFRITYLKKVEKIE